MCRSIHVLRQADVPASAEDIAAAALQYVRKVSGYSKPSKANIEAFDAAVLEVAAATQRLLDSISEHYPASAKRAAEAAGASGVAGATASARPHRHGRGANAIIHAHD
jgi:hypothetical protein